MSEDIDGVVSSVGKDEAIVIVISGKVSKADAEKLRTELQKVAAQFKLKIQLKKPRK